jgi:hypothetical protein
MTDIIGLNASLQEAGDVIKRLDNSLNGGAME